MRLLVNLALLAGIIALVWWLWGAVFPADPPTPEPFVAPTPPPLVITDGMLVTDYQRQAEEQCRRQLGAVTRTIPRDNRAAFLEATCACFQDAQQAGFVTSAAMAEAIRQTQEVDETGRVIRVDTGALTLQAYGTQQAFDLTVQPCYDRVRDRYETPPQ